jgi:hypothetical protein
MIENVDAEDRVIVEKLAKLQNMHSQVSAPQACIKHPRVC